MSASAACQVRNGDAGSYVDTTDGVNITAGEDISIRLTSGEGIKNWVLECFGTDELGTPDAINELLSVDGATFTATFTAPNEQGRTLLFRSTGTRHNGTTVSETFGLFITTLAGRRVCAVNQTFEGNSSFGWSTTINDLIRNGAYGDYAVIREKTLLTEDATPTNITFNWDDIEDIPDDCVVYLDAIVMGRNTDDGTEFVRLQLARSMYVVAGTGTFNGSTREFDAERPGLGSAAAVIGRDAGTLRPYITVTGVAGKPIAWKAILQYNVLATADDEAPPPEPGFDVADRAYAGLWFADDFNVGTQQWPGTASAGSSGTKTAAKAGGSDTAYGTEYNGRKSLYINGAQNIQLVADAADLYGTTGTTFWVVANVLSSATANDTNPRNEESLIAGGHVYIGVDSSGNAAAEVYDGGAFQHTADISRGTGLAIFQVRFDETNLSIRKNKGAWTSVACATLDVSSFVDVHVGISTISGYTTDTEVCAYGFIKEVLADGDLDDDVDYLANYYGITV